MESRGVNTPNTSKVTVPYQMLELRAYGKISHNMRIVPGHTFKQKIHLF